MADLKVWGSYRLIANTFKWLALAPLAYVGAAPFTRPDPGEVLRSTLVPTLSLDQCAWQGRNGRHVRGPRRAGPDLGQA